jgi:hypothetical protein
LRLRMTIRPDTGMAVKVTLKPSPSL